MMFKADLWSPRAHIHTHAYSHIHIHADSHVHMQIHTHIHTWPRGYSVPVTAWLQCVSNVIIAPFGATL